MVNIPNCPKCDSEYTYEDGMFLVCPECSHEWNPKLEEDETEEVIESQIIQYKEPGQRAETLGPGF